MNSSLMRFGLLACVGYFICMSVAHFFGLKMPLLFVYYDTPFYAYQDKIIAFAITAYIGLFLAATKHRSVVPTALTVMGLTVLGLASVNLSDDLALVMTEQNNVMHYWAQTGLLGGMFLILVMIYLRDSRG